jgi:hypothetical protein
MDLSGLGIDVKLKERKKEDPHLKAMGPMYRSQPIGLLYFI